MYKILQIHAKPPLKRKKLGFSYLKFSEPEGEGKNCFHLVGYAAQAPRTAPTPKTTQNQEVCV